MGVQTWRRLHGDFIADVISIWPASYRVAVSHAPSGVTRELPKVFQRLQSAQAAADDYLRRTFSHKCGMESCGAWLLWTG